MKAELSEKNKYYVPKYRYYELKYYCLQYTDWSKAYKELDVKNIQLKSGGVNLLGVSNHLSPSDVVSRLATKKARYHEKIESIHKALEHIDKTIQPYLLKGVIKGESYDKMSLHDVLPCSKAEYYDNYRRFFWELDRIIE